MRLEDIVITDREKNARKELYQAKFRLDQKREPLIGVMGVGAVARIYAAMLSISLDSLLYTPKIDLIGQDIPKSGAKREHLAGDVNLSIQDRFSTINYEEFGNKLSEYDLLFITLGTNTDSADRTQMVPGNLSLVEKLLFYLPWKEFNGILSMQSNIAELNLQKIARLLKDPRMGTGNGPLDLWRIQKTIARELKLQIPPYKIRVSVGGNHPNPYGFLDRVLVEGNISSSGDTIYLTDISEQIQDINKLLIRTRGTSISEEARKIPYISFQLQQMYGKVGTPTDISTAASMLELTKSIINRFGSTAISYLTPNGIFEYGNYHFTNGFPEQDEERIVKNWSGEDRREIKEREKQLRKLLKKHLGKSYEINLPKNTSNLEDIFCPNGRQEPDKLKEIVLTEFDGGVKARMNSHSLLLKEIKEINSTVYVCNSFGTARYSSQEEVPKVETFQTSDVQEMIDLDSILKGKTFRKLKLSSALAKALNYGLVVTMPEMIAAKVRCAPSKGKKDYDLSHGFWNASYDVHTEENIGIDQKGRFHNAGEPVLVLVNGGGILTPARIKQARRKRTVRGSAKYSNEEFDNLLNGKLPDGTSIELYSYEDIKKGVSNLPHRFGVVMPYSAAQNTKSTCFSKGEFLVNPLVIARNAGLQNLEEYFERAKYKSDGMVSCCHPFNNRDATIPQGRVLCLYNSDLGLYAINILDLYSRCIGVSSENKS